MRLPRDLSGQELIARLKKLGYTSVRQTGSHVRLTYSSAEAEYHLTIPLHTPLRVGTLNAILGEIAQQLNLSREEILQRLR